MTGTIARLMNDKGFGFVQGADDGREYFFHRSVVSGAEWFELYAGQPVTFTEEHSERGLRAQRVVVARGTPRRS